MPLPTPEQMTGPDVTEKQFKNRIIQLLQNVVDKDEFELNPFLKPQVLEQTVNLNDLKTTGVWASPLASWTSYDRNYPVLAGGVLTVIKQPNNTFVYQTYTSNKTTFVRKFSIEWSEWVKALDSTDEIAMRQADNTATGDLNNLKKTGFYFCIMPASTEWQTYNYPLWSSGVLEVLPYSAITVTNKLYMQRFSTSASTFIRRMTNSTTWSEWVEVATTTYVEDTLTTKISEEFNKRNALLINKGSEYPFAKRTLNNVTTESAGTFFLNRILDIKVIGALKGKKYRISFYGGGVDGDTTSTPAAGGWSVREYNEHDYETTDNSRVVFSSYTSKAPILPNTGIQTLYLESQVEQGLALQITVDTDGYNGAVFSSLSPTSNNGYSYIIHESCYYYKTSTGNGGGNGGELIENRHDFSTSLIADLNDPLKSVNLIFLGDSNVWGAGATGAVSALAGNSDNNWRNKRNLYTVPCFVNLIRNWIALKAGTLDQPSELDPTWQTGGGYDDVSGWAGVRINSNVRLNTVIDKALSMNSKSSSGYVVALNNETVSFNILGDKVTVKALKQQAGGTLTLKVGSASSVLNTSVGEADELSITVTNPQLKNHEVVIEADGDVQLSAITHHKLVSVQNNAYSGYGAGNYQPGSQVYQLNTPAHMTHCIMWWGSNQGNKTLTQRYIEYENIVKHFQSNFAYVKLAFCTMNITAGTSVDDDGNYIRALSVNEAEQCARNYGIEVIDVWGDTLFLRMQDISFLKDDIHMNDLGHFEAAKSIINQIKNRSY